MPTTTTDHEPLHKAWWQALHQLCTFQAEKCGCWTDSCARCFDLAEELAKAEQALKNVGEWR